MIQRATAASLLALATAMPAAGTDLIFSAGATGEYDSNVFRRDDDVKDDYIFTLRPGVELREDRGEDLNYSLRYVAPIELSTQFSDELNDVDQIVRGRGEYRINERLTLSVRDHYRYLRSTLREEITSPGDSASGDGLPSISEVRDRVSLNDGSLSLSYLLSPRWVVRGEANSTFFDTTRDDRSRNYLVGGVVDTVYRYSQQHQVGGGARYSFQDFEERRGVASSQTHTIGIFGSWRWYFDETMQISVNAGPALLLTEQENSDASFAQLPVPFQVRPQGASITPTTAEPFLDIDGNALPVGVPVVLAPGSLIVPSFTNCGQDGGQFVFPCSPSVLIDSATDLATVNAITGAAPVTVTSTDNTGDSSQRWTIFAEVQVSKRWSPTLESAFRYSRQQGNASGLGSSVIGDSVSLSTFWDFWERWQLHVRGDWVQRESISRLNQTRLVAVGVNQADIPGGVFGATLAGVGPAGGTGSAFNSRRRATIDTNRWSVAGRVTHRLFRATQVFGQVRYDNQTSDSGTLGSTSDFENVLVLFGVQHTFEPIKLW